MVHFAGCTCRQTPGPFGIRTLQATLASPVPSTPPCGMRLALEVRTVLRWLMLPGQLNSRIRGQTRLCWHRMILSRPVARLAPRSLGQDIWPARQNLRPAVPATTTLAGGFRETSGRIRTPTFHCHGGQIVFPSPFANRSIALLACAGSCPPAAYAAAVTLPSSTRRPGPMVEETATRWIYVPLAPVGLALATASTKARMFSTSLPSSNETLPTPA